MPAGDFPMRTRTRRPLHPAPKGRAVDPHALAEVRQILGGTPRRPDLLVEHLHRLHDSFGHLSARHLVALAFELRLAHAEVYEVATFYHAFDVVKEGETPPPALTVRVCESLPCRLAGSAALHAALRDRLGPEVRLLGASCVGRCAAAPVAVAGRRPVERATTEAVIETLGAGRTDPEISPYVGYRDYRAGGGYRLLAACRAGEPPFETVLLTVEAAGLRGLGGAGYPVAKKWRVVREGATPRAVVLNADESEPGTFKDRHCLEADPHRVLEGMLIAAWAVEAGEVYIYLRDEYAGCREVLSREIEALRADPPCDLPTIDLRRGAGSYICGEETALLESLEGRRGEPRLRPPYPAQVGLFGRPTLVHNVETVYWLREILEHGGERFAARGRNGAKGQRFYSVSGRVARPGVYAAPAGITTRELVEEYAGGMPPGLTFHAFLPAGASGGILPASLADVPLDFGTLEPHGSFIGSAGVIVLSDRDRASAAAMELVGFFAHESCAKCTPCRNGTAKAVRLMEEGAWTDGRLRDLGRVMADASICGLGQAAPNGIRTVMRHFPGEIAE